MMRRSCFKGHRPTPARLDRTFGMGVLLVAFLVIAVAALAGSTSSFSNVYEEQMLNESKSPADTQTVEKKESLTGGEHTSFTQILVIATIPAATMLSGSLAAFVIEFSSSFLHSMQHFAAGVLLSAISTELLPPVIHASTNWKYRVAIGLGFGLGVLIMLGVETLSEDDDDDEEESGNDDEEEGKRPYLEENNTTTISGSSSSKGINMPLKDYGSLSSASAHPPNAAVEDRRALPIARIIAIEIDSFLDGFLLGLSAGVGSETATFVMALAISVEMGFVGVTYGSSFHQVSLRRSISPLVAAPLTLFGGTLIGYLTSNSVVTFPLFYVGLLSFGSAALLYLVCEDLLIEAHNAGEERVREVLKEHATKGTSSDECLAKIKAAVTVQERWFEDIWFFVGFLIALLTG